MTSPEAMMNSNSRPAPDLSAMLRGRDPLAPFRITLDVHSVFDQAGLLDLQESDLVNCGRREASIDPERRASIGRRASMDGPRGGVRAEGQVDSRGFGR